eukprot:TRINITY_DN10289_c0_g1_i5.p1 TRINITY_DN10289_c0_g1~~TRINITY_DN10289_c0_g1_i5.p1  ORF type:complete len:212 (+),score=5.70 TRINITY_DN10289_c0_g1_i5:73-708(+)
MCIRDRIQLKENSVNSLKSVNEALTLFSWDKNNLETIFKDRYEELKAAVECEDDAYIMNRINSKVNITEIVDIGSQLIKACGEEKQSTLINLIQKFNVTCGNLIDINYFIYGYHSGKLCRYDIFTKKLAYVSNVAIPSSCSIIQISKHIFLTGSSHCVNTVSEFVESTQTLISKQGMLCGKYCHSLQAINPCIFVSIGGYNASGSIAYCKE